MPKHDLQAVYRYMRLSEPFTPLHPSSMADIAVQVLELVISTLRRNPRPTEVSSERSRAVENSMFKGARRVNAYHSTFQNVGGDATSVS